MPSLEKSFLANKKTEKYDIMQKFKFAKFKESSLFSQYFNVQNHSFVSEIYPVDHLQDLKKFHWTVKINKLRNWQKISKKFEKQSQILLESC